jgi:carbonic anhydrase
MLPNLVAHIRPSVEPLLESRPTVDVADLTAEAVPAHVRASVARLSEGSQLLKELIAREGLQVVGAQYSLETGEVHFLDPTPES